MRSLKWLAVGLSLLALTACLGGSSDEEGQSEPPPVGTPPPQPPPPAPPPPVNQAPTISVAAETTVTAGDSFQIIPSVSDPENDPLTFSIENRPAWAAFNTTTGRLSGTPADANVGSYEQIRISVSDGVNTARSNAFRVVVNARTAPPPPSAQMLFSDGFESGSTSAWSPSSTGGVAVLNDGGAYNGSNYGRVSLTNGSNNDFGLYVNYGTAGLAATQARNFHAQLAVSFDAFSGNWPAQHQQKLFIFQYYDPSWNTFSNSRRKFQIIVGVEPESAGSQRGQYSIRLIEWDDSTGAFAQEAFINQNLAATGPASSFGSWDVLRIQVQLDTNGDGTLGVGHGNGILRLWRNNTLIIDRSNVNIVHGNANVAMGRMLLTTTSNPSTWAGSSTAVYFDQIQVANDVSVLAAMPSAPVPRSASSPPPPPTPPPPTPEPPPPTGNHNPDGITEASSVLYSRDYDTQVGSDVSSGGVINMQWSGGYGYGGSGGWRAQPNPIDGTGSNEDSKGWTAPASLGLNQHSLITVSFMMRMSGALLAAIETAGGFWSHMNKSLDFHYYDANGDMGSRGGFHFGEMPPRWHVSGGGAGPYFAMGPDWRTLADQWVWLCFVIDMRGSTPSQRYLAAYYKTAGMSGAVRMGRTYESEGLQPYGGRGIMGFPLTEIFGYWDDINSLAAVASSLDLMFVHLDRLRIMPGYPNAANGPPF